MKIWKSYLKNNSKNVWIAAILFWWNTGDRLRQFCGETWWQIPSNLLRFFNRFHRIKPEGNFDTITESNRRWFFKIILIKICNKSKNRLKNYCRISWRNVRTIYSSKNSGINLLEVTTGKIVGRTNEINIRRKYCDNRQDFSE